MKTDTSTLLAIFLAVLGIVISIVIWAASTHAARIQARDERLRKEGLIDANALEALRKVYESAIKQLEAQVVALRAEARSFEEKVIALTAECSKLRSQLAAAGITEARLPF